MRRAIWPAVLLLAASCTSGRSAESPDDGPPALVDVAAEVGIDFRHGAYRWGPSPDPAVMMGSGLCWLDFDDDGWMDLFVVNSYTQTEVARWNEEGGLPTTALFRNDEGRFDDVSDETGAALSIRGTGCVAADFNLDGAIDLFVGSERINHLLWNTGRGAFVEGAADASVGASGWHSGAAVGDLNGDGWPDLVVAGYADTNYTDPDATEGFPDTVLGVRDLLYLSNGATSDGLVTFREVGNDVGLEGRTEKGGFEYGLGVLILDIDADGDLDVYVANDTNPNRLYRNVPWPGGSAADPLGLGFRFEEVATQTGLDDDRAGMGIAVGDYDGDALPDLFVTNSRDQGHGAFRNAAVPGEALVYRDDSSRFTIFETYTGWGVSWFDLDRDTDLDVLIANGRIPVSDLDADARPLQLLENRSGADLHFADVGSEYGLDAIGPLHGRGSAAADFDNDGDIDVAVNSVGGRLVLLENRGSVGAWLTFEFEAFRPGTSVTLTLPDGRQLVRYLAAGSSYLSSEDPRAHFGLGDAEVVPEVTINWPGGIQSRLTDVDANQRVTVSVP